LSVLVAPLATAAPPRQMARIGVFEFGAPPGWPDWKTRSPLLQALRAPGWLERQNLTLEYRWGEAQRSRLPTLAAELVQLHVDVLVVHDNPAIEAVTRATTTIPIVMASVADPEEWGAVATLARPGGNVTGIGGVVLELSAKLLELLTEAVPGVTRMALLTDLGRLRRVHATERAAQAVGLHTHLMVVGSPDQFESAFQDARRAGAGALVVLPSAFLAQHLSRIAALALQHGLPAIFWSQRFAEVGGLMAYGPSVPHLWQRAAAQVDKILKGAKPARPAGGTTDDLRVRDQPEDSPGVGPHHPTIPPPPGDRGDPLSRNTWCPRDERCFAR
jgi:putative ABC transport system substrate-binding protein